MASAATIAHCSWMKSLLTAEAVSKGGRSGTIKTPNGLPIVELGNPLQVGGAKPGPEIGRAHV